MSSLTSVDVRPAATKDNVCCFTLAFGKGLIARFDLLADAQLSSKIVRYDYVGIKKRSIEDVFDSIFCLAQTVTFVLSSANLLETSNADSFTTNLKIVTISFEFPWISEVWDV